RRGAARPAVRSGAHHQGRRQRPRTDHCRAHRDRPRRHGSGGVRAGPRDHFPPAHPAGARGLSMRTVLIADDEPNLLSSLGDALRREGYQVDVASSVAEAREKLRDAYDFALLDVRFRDGEGLDLLSEIRAGAPETVVVMMSGHATIDTAVRATRLGAW